MRRFIDLAGVETRRAKADGDLIVPMAFSSEEPVERWWGIEILDHSDASIRLERLNNGAPLLFNHDWYDLRGTHEPGTVKVGKDRVLRGDIRITSATQPGRDTIGLVESKVLTKASVGYRVHMVVEQTTKRDGSRAERQIPGEEFERLLERYEEQGSRNASAFRRDLDKVAPPIAERKDDDEPVYRIMDWEPFENSLVTVPADDSVGLGRGVHESTVHEFGQRTSRGPHPAVSAATKKEPSMKTEAELAAEAEAAEKAKREREAREKAEREARERLAEKSVQELEQGRIRAINNIAQMNKIPDNIRDTWVNRGYSIEQVTEDVLKIFEERGKSNPQPASRIGLTANESQRFSLTRAIIACKDKDWKNASFELEASRAVAQKLGKVAEEFKFYVPFEVLERPLELTADRAAAYALAAMGRRDLTVATAGAGGFLVGTDNIGFIEMLRNRSVLFRMGARRLSGLQGSVTVPRQSAASTAVWLANEAATITESQQTFVQMALSPKTVGAYTEISRQLLLQSSPGAEGIVSDDLAQVIAIAADLAGLEGSGAGGQPTGLSNTAGIGSVSGTSLAAAGILEFQSDVASANVMPARFGYVTTPVVAAGLMVKPELPSTGTTRLWTGNMWDGQLFGLPAMSTNQVTAATMTAGDWQELIMAEWGVLEVEVNPYANFQAGIVGVRAIYSLDVGVRRPFAFSRATTIT